VYVGANSGWDDELKKILGIPATLPARTVIELPTALAPAAAQAVLDRWMQSVSQGNKRWAGNKGFFFYRLTDPKTGQPRQSPGYWGQSEVYGIVTISPGKVMLEVPQGLLDGRDKRAKAWETMLAGQLAELVGAGLPTPIDALKAAVNALPIAANMPEPVLVKAMAQKLALAVAGTYPTLVSKIPPTALEQWFEKLAIGWSREGTTAVARKLGKESPIGSIQQMQAMPKQGGVVFMAFYKPVGLLANAPGRPAPQVTSRTYTIPVFGADSIPESPTRYWVVSNRGKVVLKTTTPAAATAKPGAAGGAKTPAQLAKILALGVAASYPALVSKIAPIALESWFEKLTSSWGKTLKLRLTQIQAMPKAGAVDFQAFFASTKKGAQPVSRKYTIPVNGGDTISPKEYWTVNAAGTLSKVPLVPSVTTKTPATVTPIKPAGGGGGMAAALGIGAAIALAAAVGGKKRR